MKSKLNKIFSFLLILLLLTGCNGIAANDGVRSDTTYPSQFLAGEVYVLKTFEKIDGNIVGFDTTLIIEEGAAVLGDIILFGSDLEVAGRVSGDINLFGGKSHILQTGLVTGSINKVANNQEVETGASIYGEINTFQFENIDIEENFQVPKGDFSLIKPRTLIIIQIIRNILLLLINILIIFLFKDQTIRVSYKLQQDPLVSWIVGLLTYLAIPIVSFVLIISICLSPIGLIFLLILFIINLWGWAVTSYFLGSNLAKWFRIDSKDFGTVAMGTIFFGIIFSVSAFLPLLNIFLSLTISTFGIGSIVYFFISRKN